MLNLKNTLDGYLKNVEVIGNTVQDTNNLADIRSVGDKVEGQELYKIPVVSCGKNLFDGVVYKEGGFYDTDGRWAVSPNIDTYRVRVNPNTTYIKSGAWNGINAFFDKDMNFISGINTIKPITPDNCYYMTSSVSVSADLTEVQIEEGTVATSYEPYKENKLEILSPVQLEKVGDVADRIVCKDGVWGVEKCSKSVTVKGDETITIYQARANVIVYRVAYADLKSEHSNNILSNKFIANKDITGNHDVEGICVYTNDNIYVSINKSKLTTQDVKGFSTWLKENDLMVKYPVKQPQFIPLPHDQQVKLRTFAGQTNIAFLTEIPGQIKAQVPKSLGATVNTHTEQIKELHNSLDRVKKLEESTVSTIETGSSFTTVDATSNGYFEGVKLEGKTLVNHLRDGVGKVELVQDASRNTNKDYHLTKYELNTDYYIIFPNFTPSSANVLSNIYGGFVNGDWLCRVNFKGDSSGVYKIRIDDREPSFFRIYVERGTSEHKLSFDGAMLIPCSEITYEQALELACFEGLLSVGQDVDEVSVKSVTGNLFDGNVSLGYLHSNGSVASHKTWVVSDFIDIQGVSQLRFESTVFNGLQSIGLYNSDKEIVSNIFAPDTFVKVDKSVKYVRVAMCKNPETEPTQSELENPCIEMYVTNKTGKKHQSNKKPLLYYNPTAETWEKPILREWDTIEKHSDGKYYYHKRSGEIMLNGSESFRLNTNFNTVFGNTETVAFTYVLQGYLKNLAPNTIVCDTFRADLDKTDDIDGIYNQDTYAGYNTIAFKILKGKLATPDVEGFKAWLKANPTKLVYKLEQEEVYECTNIDLMTYSGETNYIINSGAISPKSLIKVHNNISNVVKILQEKVNLLENTFIAGLKSVLSGDMYSLATILYPEDFEQNDNTEQDIMVIPE